MDTWSVRVRMNEYLHADTICVDGIRARGRGKKKWDECVDEDMRILGLNRMAAQDRVVWKSCASGNRLTRARMEK